MQGRQRGRAHQHVHLLPALDGHPDAEAEHHHAPHAVGRERGDQVGAQAPAVGQGLLRVGQPEEGEEEHGQRHDGHAEGGDAPADAQLAPRLRQQHAPEWREFALRGNGAHGAPSARRVSMRNASSRSAPVTSRSTTSTPRRNSSRSTAAGSLLSKLARSPLTLSTRRGQAVEIGGRERPARDQGDLLAGYPRLQLLRARVRDDRAAVDHDDPPGQLLGLARGSGW